MRALTDDNLCFLGRAATNEFQRKWFGNHFPRQLRIHVFQARDRTSRQRNQNIPDYNSGVVRRSIRFDFENDCVGTSLAVARELGDRLYGVRLDTSETLVDKSVIPQMGTFKPAGVNPQLVWNVRQALDRDGFQHVKIVVSGGFTVEKIRQFEEHGVPVDAYGVGSSLFQGRFDFTADVVMVDGKPRAKVGRAYRPNARLERVT